LPLLSIVSRNGGWTADPERTKHGRYLGYTRYVIRAQRLGCPATTVRFSNYMA
jgi:acetolactate synthase-1/2/3 large subunit